MCILKYCNWNQQIFSLLDQRHCHLVWRARVKLCNPCSLFSVAYFSFRMSTSISEKALVPGLLDLLTNIDPSLKSTINNVEVAEDVLLHLEETDETFHK